MWQICQPGYRIINTFEDGKASDDARLLSAQHPWSEKNMAVTTQALLLHPPQSLFFILPFFWLPRPKPDFLISESHCLFLARSFFMPPPCKNFCFCTFLRCFKIWSLVLSSERTLRPPGDCCGTAGLWGLGPRPLRPRPRPRPPPGDRQ